MIRLARDFHIPEEYAKRMKVLEASGIQFNKIVRIGISACWRTMQLLSMVRRKRKPLGLQCWLYGSAAAGYSFESVPRKASRCHTPVWVRGVAPVKANTSEVFYTLKWRGQMKRQVVFNSEISIEIKEKFNGTKR